MEVKVEYSERYYNIPITYSAMEVNNRYHLTPVVARALCMKYGFMKGHYHYIKGSVLKQLEEDGTIEKFYKLYKNHSNDMIRRTDFKGDGK